MDNTIAEVLLRCNQTAALSVNSKIKNVDYQLKKLLRKHNRSSGVKGYPLLEGNIYNLTIPDC